MNILQISQPYGDLERREMLRYIPETATTILDVGCHTGTFGKILKASGINTVWGVEPNPVSAAAAMQHLDKVIVGSFEGNQIPDAYFDVIVFNDVLEHISDPRIILKIAIDKLKDDGIVIASIPNIRHIDNLIHIIFDKDFRYEKNGIRDETHLRFYTKKSIPRLFEQSGYFITNMEGINENWWSRSLTRRIAFRLFSTYLEYTKYMQFAVIAKPNKKLGINI